MPGDSDGEMIDDKVKLEASGKDSVILPEDQKGTSAVL